MAQNISLAYSISVLQITSNACVAYPIIEFQMAPSTCVAYINTVLQM